MIDTHAHIFGEKFSDIEDVVQDFKASGIDKVVMPNIDHSTIDSMLAVEERFSGTCYATMGLHPTSVKKDFERELYIVEDWLSKRSFVALGEMGTDLYWSNEFWNEQQEAFKIQCELAVKHDLPIIIHCRESIDETIQLIRNLKLNKLRGIFHCFTGTKTQAEEIIELGFYLGIGGVVTFKNSTLSEVLVELGPDKLVLETDSPYLAPTPNRGKRNTPAYLTFIRAHLAKCLSITEEELGSIALKNTLEIFDFKDEL